MSQYRLNIFNGSKYGPNFSAFQWQCSVQRKWHVFWQQVGTKSSWVLTWESLSRATVPHIWSVEPRYLLPVQPGLSYEPGKDRNSCYVADTTIKQCLLLVLANNLDLIIRMLQE